MTETEELLTDLRAVYSEMHPNRPPEAMQVSDDVLALGILMRREMRMGRPLACAPLEGAQTLRSFTPRGRIIDALAELNPMEPK